MASSSLSFPFENRYQETNQTNYHERLQFPENYQDGFQLPSENYHGQYNMTHLYYQFFPENHQEQDQIHLKNHQELISFNERESHLNEREFLLNERESLLSERESHLKEKEYQFKKST
ncbi:10637_t:CDS:2 [Gigaspora margarita]|uniref:10637_t:CDS:1 n=1 Tax=Gigaspora margarita TaxID=4874 RepID=A0ABM8W3V6_GIGMA|nr:10637_t:CDS:2 [Gigaspora margarita]